MAEKKKNVIYTTPAGIAVFPWITQPDTKFKAEGEYSTKLRLPKDEAGDLLALIEGAANEAFEDAKKHIEKEAKTPKDAKIRLSKLKEPIIPFKTALDDEGNETDDVELVFKMKAYVVPKNGGKPFTQKPKVFDAKGKEMTGVAIYGGSKIKVAFQLNPFYTAIGAGVTLRLVAVQVLELVTGGGNAGSFGFGEEEGYEYDGSAASEEKADEEESIDCGGEF